MPKLLSLILIFAIFLAFSTLQAQAQTVQPTISTLEVDLWPEFDQQGILVIYKIILPASGLPVDLTLRIPGAVSTPHVVAVGATLEQVSDQNVSYKTQAEGNWTLVTVTMNAPALQFEYYDLALDTQSGQRTYTYRWPGGVAVESMRITVQQPFAAANMRISASNLTSFSSSDGLTYYQTPVGALGADQTFDLSLSYTKNSESLTVENLQVQTAYPQPVNNLAQYWPWILGGLGVLLIGGGLGWYWFLGRQRDESPDNHRRRRRAASHNGGDTQEESAYCHMCGSRAVPGDQFCRACGTRLRTG